MEILWDSMVYHITKQHSATIESPLLSSRAWSRFSWYLKILNYNKYNNIPKQIKTFIPIKYEFFWRKKHIKLLGHLEFSHSLFQGHIYQGYKSCNYLSPWVGPQTKSNIGAAIYSNICLPFFHNYSWPTGWLQKDRFSETKCWPVEYKWEVKSSSFCERSLNDAIRLWPILMLSFLYLPTQNLAIAVLNNGAKGHTVEMEELWALRDLGPWGVCGTETTY